MFLVCLSSSGAFLFFFFFQAEDGIRDRDVTGVQTCALPILGRRSSVTSRESGRGGITGTGWSPSGRGGIGGWLLTAPPSSRLRTGATRRGGRPGPARTPSRPP